MKNMTKKLITLILLKIITSGINLHATNHFIEPSEVFIHDNRFPNVQIPNIRHITGIDQFNKSIEDLNFNIVDSVKVGVFDINFNYHNIRNKISPECLNLCYCKPSLFYDQSLNYLNHGSNVASLVCDMAPYSELSLIDINKVLFEDALKSILFDSFGNRREKPSVQYLNMSSSSKMTQSSYNIMLEMGRLGVGIIVSGGNVGGTIGHSYLGRNASSSHFVASCFAIAEILKNENAPGFLEFSISTSYNNGTEVLSDFSSKASIESRNYTIASPGENILVETFDGYNTIASGTSFSAPTITAILAHLTQAIQADMSTDEYLKRYQITPREVLNLVHDFSRNRSLYDEKNLFDDSFGYGVIDINEAWDGWINFAKWSLREKLHRKAYEENERLEQEALWYITSTNGIRRKNNLTMRGLDTIDGAFGYDGEFGDEEFGYHGMVIEPSLCAPIFNQNGLFNFPME